MRRPFAAGDFARGFPDGPPEGDDRVLEHAHRAYRGAVDAPEKQRENDQGGYHPEVQGEAGGEKLQFRGPAPPLCADADKQQGCRKQEEAAGQYSDFSKHSDSKIAKNLRVEKCWKKIRAKFVID